MHGPHDTLGRWVQYGCAVALLGLATVLWRFGTHRYETLAACFCAGLAGRCLWYAISGRHHLGNPGN